jgi:hypothetical protein
VGVDVSSVAGVVGETSKVAGLPSVAGSGLDAGHMEEPGLLEDTVHIAFVESSEVEAGYTFRYSHDFVEMQQRPASSTAACDTSAGYMAVAACVRLP